MSSAWGTFGQTGIGEGTALWHTNTKGWTHCNNEFFTARPANEWVSSTCNCKSLPPPKKNQTTTKSNRWKETHSISAYSSPVAQSAVCPTLMGLKAELRRLCDTTRQVRHKARAVPIPNSHQHWETSQKTGTQHPKHWDLTAPHTLLCCKCCLQNPVSTSRGKKHKLEYINL